MQKPPNPVNKPPERAWTRSDGAIINDEGENQVPARFANAIKEIDHYDDHCKDYPGLTMSQYTTKAADLASSKVGGGIRGFSTDDGCVVRYDRAENDFVKAYSGIGGYVRTFYKPAKGLAYYNDEKKRSWKFRKVKK